MNPMISNNNTPEKPINIFLGLLGTILFLGGFFVFLIFLTIAFIGIVGFIISLF